MDENTESQGAQADVAQDVLAAPEDDLDSSASEQHDKEAETEDLRKSWQQGQELGKELAKSLFGSIFKAIDSSSSSESKNIGNQKSLGESDDVQDSSMSEDTKSLDSAEAAASQESESKVTSIKDGKRITTEKICDNGHCKTVTTTEDVDPAAPGETEADSVESDLENNLGTWMRQSPSFLQRAQTTHKRVTDHATSALADSTDVVMQVVLKRGASPSAVRVKLHPEWAPVGVAQFQNLVSSHAMDEAAFFRVVPGFVVQFGLPAKPQAEMAPLQDDPVKVSNQRGTLVFATSGPNTRTNQLFINLGNNANLDAQGFSPIGEVVDGMEAIDAINPEYGEQPDQSSITAQGDAYLDPLFPNLSKIK
jgi:cyclophilin family peptidyl-prolyl cis-trans isomerase